MRIVNAMFGCGLGGIEQALVDYCEALALCGHEPVAIIHPDAQIKDALAACKFAFHTLPNMGAWDPIAIFKLRALLKKLEAGLLIAHGNRALSLATRAATGIRIAAPMHNYKIKSEAVRFVLYPTQDLLRHAQGGGAAGRHFYHVPNLVRVPEEFSEREWRTPPVIGAMGRFVAKKGFDLFIDALGLLKSRNIPFSGVLAGDGEEAQALRARAAQKGLGDVLRFAGWVEDKEKFFGEIDIFCLPSLHEPFGIVLLEAMAHSLPAVATASEGPSEILTNGTDGTLVAKGDAAALADALTDMLCVPARAQVLARGAWQTARTRYDLPVVAAKLDLAVRAIGQL